MRTVGVEEELLLVDAATGQPRAVASRLLAEVPDPNTRDPGGSVGAELQEQQIEVDTPPAADLEALSAALRQWRGRADDLARTTGARAVALATSPLAADPEVTPKPRYQAMVEHFGLTTTEQLTCGMHVHVNVASPAEGVAVLDRVRVWLPVLLALSANSPYWQGRDSGYASFRSQAWHRFPSSGPTEVFGTPERYAERLDALVASGVVLDRAMVYFDARLSERYPTVEIRVADVCLWVDDTVLLAALCRALVETAAREAVRGQAAPEVPTEFIRLATWRAGRSGLAEDLLDPYTTRPRPAAEVVDRLLTHVRTALLDTGDVELVERSWGELRSRGPGAVAQRRWAAAADLSHAVLRAADVTLE